MLSGELRLAMALAGQGSVAGLDRSLLQEAGSAPAGIRASRVRA
jgi:hypothetical protein